MNIFLFYGFHRFLSFYSSLPLTLFFRYRSRTLCTTTSYRTAVCPYRQYSFLLFNRSRILEQPSQLPYLTANGFTLIQNSICRFHHNYHATHSHIKNENTYLLYKLKMITYIKNRQFQPYMN